jgi:hypothetical protein
MEDARHYRERADIALKLARQISDAKAAAGLRQLAAQYHARAEDLEAGQTNREPPNNPSPRGTAPHRRRCPGARAGWQPAAMGMTDAVDFAGF